MLLVGMFKRPVASDAHAKTFRVCFIGEWARTQAGLEVK
jgi:hypothetical protein